MNSRIFHIIAIVFIIALTILVAGCSGSGDDVNVLGDPDGNGSAEEGPSDVTDAIDEESGESNVIEDTFGVDGNLYKPESDEASSGNGNLVILLGQKYTQQMETCSIPLRDGSTGVLICIDDQPWTQTPFSCFSNMNRQTWRAAFRCEEVGEIVVTCFIGEQEYRFTPPGGQVGNICTRFG